MTNAAMSQLLLNDSLIHQPTRVILVRHGRTTYNEQGRYQGSCDRSILTSQGYRDAYATGIALQQFKFDAVYTSPLKRVQQTTQAIVAALNRAQNLPVYVEPKLTEISMLDWQGLSYQEVKETFPQAYNCWQLTPHLFTRNQIDYPVLELFQQAQQFWQQALKKHRGQTILIVAHSGTNRALISTAISLKPQHYHFLQQSNCGISCLEFAPAHNIAQLKYLNITQHLKEQLPKLKAGKTGLRWLLITNNTSSNSLKNSCLTDLPQQIDLILTDNKKQSEILANNLLQYSPSIMHLSIKQNDFLDSWHQTILSKQSNTNKKLKLFTSVILASEKKVAQILTQVFSPKTALSLADCLTVVHYPDSAKSPIIQGILPLNQLSINSKKSAYA